MSLNHIELIEKRINLCGRRDLNPGSQAWKACVLNQLDDDRAQDTSLIQQNKHISTKADEAIINTLITIKSNRIKEATCRQISYKLKETARNSGIIQPKESKTIHFNRKKSNHRNEKI